RKRNPIPYPDRPDLRESRSGLKKEPRKLECLESATSTTKEFEHQGNIPVKIVSCIPSCLRIQVSSHFPASLARFTVGPYLAVQRARDSSDNLPDCLLSPRRSRIPTPPRSEAVRINRPNP